MSGDLNYRTFKSTAMNMNWTPIERHPRLVFDEFGPDEEAIVRYYIARGKPFTVVIKPFTVVIK